MGNSGFYGMVNIMSRNVVSTNNKPSACVCVIHVIIDMLTAHMYLYYENCGK